MVIDKGTNDREFILDGEKIEEVQQFEYLGSMINSVASDSTTEIKQRLAMARSTTQNMVKIWEKQRTVNRFETPISCEQLLLQLLPMDVSHAMEGR